MKPVQEQERYFFKATGMVEMGRGNTNYRTVPKAPKEDRGKTGYNNGVRCFVDRQGDYYVGRDTPQALRALLDAGYRDVGHALGRIPFSSGGSTLVDRVFSDHTDHSFPY